MATIINDRDVLLQATSPRYTTPGDRALLLTSTSPVFHVPETGPVSPGTITFTATLINIIGTVTFSASLGSTLTGVTATTCVLDYADMAGDTEVIQAQITYDSVLYQKSLTVVKVNDGATGADGSSGPVQIHISGQTSWSDTVANDAIMTYAGRAPINRDIVTQYNESPAFSQTKFYDAGSWITMDAYIPGNLLVSGTVSADVLSGGTIRGINIEFGTGHTVGGFAFEITSAGVVWTDNLFGGTLVGNNTYSTTVPAVRGTSDNNSAKGGVEGWVTILNTNTSAYGVGGSNFYSGTNGLIATGNGYDFYANGSGTNYGPFTGAHDILLPLETSAVPGDLLVDVECVARRGWSNTLFVGAPAEQDNAPAVIGVLARTPVPLADHVPAVFVEGFVTGVGPDHHERAAPIVAPEYQELKDQYLLGAVNAVGEGQLNVCGLGGDIAAGDLLVASSLFGKAMRQADNVNRSYTVARAREAVVFSSPDEVKTVACVYLCG